MLQQLSQKAGNAPDSETQTQMHSVPPYGVIDVRTWHCVHALQVTVKQCI